MSLFTDPTKLKTETILNCSPKQNVKNNLNWFVFYTYSKSERKVEFILRELGYETYLPCSIVTKQWHDRKKKLRIPLFPNYIFVRTSINKIHYINDINLISSYVKFKNNPAIIKDEEIHRIKTMLEYSDDINVSNDFQCGDKVKILSGPLIGLNGIILEKNSTTKFVIYIKELKQYVSVSIDLSKMDISKNP